MLVSRKVDIVLLGSVPPPFHGQAIMTAEVFSIDWAPLRSERVEAAFSRSMHDVGALRFRKVLVLFGALMRLLFLRFFRGARVLYVTAGSARWAPLLRDAVLIGLGGRLFPHLVVHYHSGGLPEMFSRSFLASILGRLAYGGAEVAVGLCRGVAVPVYGGTRLEIVPNGLRIDAGPWPAGGSGTLRLLYVGSLRRTKGVDTLLEAMAADSLLGRDNLECHLVGEWASEEERRALEPLVARLPSGRVVLHGLVTGGEKLALLRQSDLFVFPSRYQSENQPLVVIEAFACGLPVIGSSWRGIPEMIEDGANGILVPASDAGALAEAIELLLDDPGLRSRMGAKARSSYEKNHTELAFSRRIRELICEIASHDEA